MKIIKLFSILMLFVSLAPAYSMAAADEDNKQYMQQDPAVADTQLTNGIIKKVNKHTGKVTITHDQLPNGMPGMTMAFPVKEAKWLNTLKPGQKVRFAEEDINGIATIVQLEVIE